MEESEVYGILTGVFHDIFMRNDIVLRPGMTAADVPGWDSFRQIEIILAAQQRFGFRFSTKELDGLEHVGDLVKIIMANAKADANPPGRIG
jgi:acyl carrier protein